MELGAEIFFSSGKRVVKRGVTRHRHWVLAAIGILALGAALGAVATLIVPVRIMPRPVVPGLSLVLGPVLAGGCMHAYGRWRKSRGKTASRLATFPGGALFAFGFALARFLLLTTGFAIGTG
ncbi:MAG: hypothetical protein V4617_01690 [Gemmatimonadota bacterium]